MQRDQQRISDSHDEMSLTTESTAEAQAYERVFPDPMPSTHVLAYRWETDAHGRRVVTFGPALAGGPAPAAATDDGGPGVSPEAVAELNRLTVKELQTRAGELGVAYEAKWNKAQLVSAIVERQADAAAGK